MVEQLSVMGWLAKAMAALNLADGEAHYRGGSVGSNVTSTQKAFLDILTYQIEVQDKRILIKGIVQEDYRMSEHYQAVKTALQKMVQLRKEASGKYSESTEVNMMQCKLDVMNLFELRLLNLGRV